VPGGYPGEDDFERYENREVTENEDSDWGCVYPECQSVIGVLESTADRWKRG